MSEGFEAGLPPLATWSLLAALIPLLWSLPWPLGFLFESLGVGCAIPHHHDCFLVTFSQLGVCVLNSETLWQRAIFGSQCLGHDVDALRCVGLFHLHRYNMRGESINSLCIFTDDHLVITIWAGLFCVLVVYHCGCSPSH